MNMKLRYLLLTLEQVVQSHIKLQSHYHLKKLSFGAARANVRLLSDTIAISLQYEDQNGKSLRLMREVHALCVKFSRIRLRRAERTLHVFQFSGNFERQFCQFFASFWWHVFCVQFLKNEGMT